ncbi:sarcoplasmic reticulum histidine-rich calcium-binding protein-like [Liolophura sinensis]|uniref:sarcoplasmic reticulum histidine-rich calcium-binding protein-like n=1 Tax=Liolophura sinensis TaxID=3198878 RepID=UPI00315887C0
MDFRMGKSTVILLSIGMFVFCMSFVICDDKTDDVNMDDETLEYAKGSVCGYCSYCKFCKLCDEDCPCDTSPSQPNCKMCKYCKYCYLCKGVCDTICKPGGIVDKVSAAIVNSLPYANRDEIDKDIDSVKSWIDKTKDEL